MFDVETHSAAAGERRRLEVRPFRCVSQPIRIAQLASIDPYLTTATSGRDSAVARMGRNARTSHRIRSDNDGFAESCSPVEVRCLAHVWGPGPKIGPIVATPGNRGLDRRASLAFESMPARLRVWRLLRREVGLVDRLRRRDRPSYTLSTSSLGTRRAPTCDPPTAGLRTGHQPPPLVWRVNRPVAGGVSHPSEANERSGRGHGRCEVKATEETAIEMLLSQPEIVAGLDLDDRDQDGDEGDTTTSGGS